MPTAGREVVDGIGVECRYTLPILNGLVIWDTLGEKGSG